MLEKNFSNDEERQRDSSNQKRDRVRFAEVLEEEARVSPKAPMCAMKTEQLRQLCAGKEKRYAALESGHDALRNEIHHDSGLREPRNEGDERDEQRCAGREHAKTHRITARHFAERRADDQRDGGSNRNRSVPRTAKGPEDQATRQASVKTSFRRQIGKRRVAQSRGKQICGKRNAGENIASEPTSIITA